MDVHWAHGRPGYRCRHGYTTGTPRLGHVPRNVYVREDHLLETLPSLLQQDGWVQARAPGGASGYLRQHGLEIVCTKGNPSVRRAPSRRVINPAVAPGQQATLALDLGTGLVEDRRASCNRRRPP
ncbi:hypothetical protein [Amycolatopsis aidingensis]|uniref:hypothetical protein n=1 Tax=Amycolatopsis aidingensis TaxID=2842453 RepID=UPI0038CBFA08